LYPIKQKLRNILKIGIGIIVIGFSLYHISLWKQKRNLNKYGTDFNYKRTELGMAELPKDWSSDEQTWNNWNELSDEYYSDNKLSKFIEIYSLSDIPTGIIFEKDKSKSKNNYHTKVVWLNTNLLFWRNKITSELDVYSRTLDSVTEENLLIRYYFRDDNGNKDYFEADYYQINENEFGFCGTPAVMEREEQRISGKPYFGNISKKQADSILKKWTEQ
jgi:hypothetical protein